ncbi:hypothetical protein [uncultured Duncaniella sp.]|uniref:HEPN domain-containing protein n=1 Tax=uncultured Duncaniella sp. TaxID=2768039 RepID=UPI00259CB840|nr:hypothetical protein [uncultured Duncaniella sp.]
MVTFEFNPTADYIVLTVKCPNCGSVISQSIGVPSPDFSADTHRESVNQDFDELYCENCGKELSVILSCGYNGGDGEIDDIEDEDLIDVNQHFPEEDWDDIDENFFNHYINPHVKDLDDSLNHLDELPDTTKNIIYRNFFANVISCMEAYLSDTAIRKIMHSDDYKKKFVKSSPHFNNLRIKGSNIYEYYAKLDTTIQFQLREIIYHKLEVVKKLYKSTFNVDLGDIGTLMKAIQKRHDIVHRNGHDKNGNVVEVTKADVQQLILDVSNFINHIENQFLGIQIDECVNSKETPLNMEINSD